jgi:putative salt-induced outer membrane protein YdiY
MVLAPVIDTFAADAPPPPEGVWTGKGQFGFLDSKGNSNAESLNA